MESTNAHRYLNPLTEAGILIETTTGSRNRVWRSPEVLAALDAFADAPAGEADTREFTSDISGRQGGVSSCCFGWCVSCILKPRLRMLIIEAAKKHLGRDISDVSMP